MNRIEQLREYIDAGLLSKNHDQDRRCAYIHLYGVSSLCALLALKRCADVELAIIAGMLHDYYTYIKKEEVRHLGMDAINEVIANHAVNGAVFARKILEELKLTSDNETDIICTAIHNHSRKNEVHSEIDEILKDSDVLQHYLYNPSIKSKNERMKKALSELGI